MDVKQAIGRRIKSLRALRSYSQERLSEMVGISPNYLSNIERGKENPTLDLFIKMSKGLKVEMHEIFATEVDQEPKDVRKRLRQLIDEITEPDLKKILRVLETLLH